MSNQIPNQIPGAALRIPSGHQFEPQQVKISSANPELRSVQTPAPIEHLVDLGLPFGGIGTGGITWSRFGGFTRWSLKAGSHKTFREPACGFAVRVKQPGADHGWAQALQPAPENPRQLSSWQWTQPEQAGDYSALFPKAWRDIELPEQALTLSCEAFSPVIPGDLPSSSLPVVIFRWTLTNTGDSPLEAGLLGHWANQCGWFTELDTVRPARRGAGSQHLGFKQAQGQGVVMDNLRFAPGGTCPEGFGQMALALASQPGLETSVAPMSNGLGDGQALWQQFRDAGVISGDSWLGDSGFRTHESALPMAAVCGSVLLQPGESRELVFVLSWDFPTVQFGLGDQRQRWYTQYWSNRGDNAQALVNHALAHRDTWSQQIDDWHSKTEAQLGIQPYQAGFALNELYFLVDGCTVLTAPDTGPGTEPETRPEISTRPAQFGLIECPDYPFYNTLDLWVYASEAVTEHWPELSQLVIDEYARSVPVSDLSPRKALNTGDCFPLKVAGALPHDHGMPEEAPFIVHNGYTLQDSTKWKDLNCQFVLEVWRAGSSLGESWRQAQFAAVAAAIERLEAFDRDGDGLIENEGYPDQTFDNIPMRGASSYCGGLWLAALSAGAKMALACGDSSRTERWCALFNKGCKAFEQKLWAGDHYRIDTDGPMSGALFLEQLFGPFLARRLGLDEIVPVHRAQTALMTLYRHNFVDAGQGIGPRLLVGATEDGIAEAAKHGDTEAQIGEVIVGIAMSFAAQLRCWGLIEQADQVRAALYAELYQKRGLFFRTPAAIEIGRQVYRAPLNLRPLAIWMDQE